MERYDVVVIGGATSGSFFAHSMAQNGFNVKVIEKASLERVGGKYDIFHVGKSSFERFGLPSVTKGDEEWAFEFSEGHTASPTGRFPKKTVGTVVGMHLHGYTVKLNRWAQQAGAQIEYEACFEDFIFENGKIAGVKYQTPQGEKEIFARAVVDCSGIEAAARRRLPRDYGVETFELGAQDMFYVVLRYVKFKDPKRRQEDSTGWPYYKSWIAPQHDPNGAIIGIGATRGYGNAQKIFESVEKNITFPEHTLEYIQRGTTPYTRSPYSFVADNFIVSGDAACLTKPNNGEGVTSSMVQLELAARVLTDALNTGEASKERLWPLNLIYNRAQGAEFASLRAMLSKAVHATESEFEYFFEHDIIFSEKFLGSPGTELSPADAAKLAGAVAAGALRGKISLKTIKSLLSGVSLSGTLKRHYLRFPPSPRDYAAWAKRADRLWARAGKME